MNEPTPEEMSNKPEPKTAEPDKPLLKALKHLEVMESVASCKLDGDTMDCAKCKAEQHKKFCEEIELIGGQQNKSGLNISISVARWQQFRRDKEIGR